MTGRRLALAIRTALDQQKRDVAVGTVIVAKGSNLATVTGIAVQPTQIDKTNWHKHFSDEVAAAGGGMSGRRVLVLFVGRQPMILGTTGA